MGEEKAQFTSLHEIVPQGLQRTFILKLITHVKMSGI